MSYLIITKAEIADASKWGLSLTDIAIVLRKDGTIGRLQSEKDSAAGACIIIINMPHPLWMQQTTEFMTRRLQVLTEAQAALGSSPRIWVHFGNCKSNNMTVDSIGQSWGAKTYADFQKTFPQAESGPMPHSRSISMDWDEKLIAFSCEVLTCISTKQSLLSTLSYQIQQLDIAWADATKHFPTRDISTSVQLQQKSNAMTALSAVAIYCDGLAYAYSTAHNRINPMKSRMAHEIPKIVAGTFEELDLEGQRVTNALAAAVPEDTAYANRATDFIEWYRSNSEKYAPDAHLKSADSSST